MSHKYFTRYLKEGEEITKITREYVLSRFFGVITSLFFIILAFFLLFPLFQKGFWGVIIFFLILSLGLWIGARLLIIWYYNAFVITNQRIIDFDQKGLFDKIVSESTYDKIQDISFKKKGLIATLFNYGTIIIQTAGQNGNLEIQNVYKPEKVQAMIAEIQKEAGQKEHSKEELSALELIAVLEQAKKKMGKEKFNEFIESQWDSKKTR